MQHTINLTYQAGASTYSVQDTIESDGEVNYDSVPDIPDATTNKEVDVAFALAKLKAIYLYASQDVTVKTNSTGSPDDTISLVAEKPLVWYTGGSFANPFTADVTKLYITNASGSDATVRLRALVDVTP